MIIMIGCPGSGKSSFVKSDVLPKGYIHVNRDTLKTAAKCMSVAEEALQSGNSVRLPGNMGGFLLCMLIVLP